MMGNMTNIEKIRAMNADELAEYLASNRFPNAPCYICPYDEGMHCISPIKCSQEYKVAMYKQWLCQTRN